jgi:hypothetical protein
MAPLQYHRPPPPPLVIFRKWKCAAWDFFILPITAVPEEHDTAPIKPGFCKIRPRAPAWLWTGDFHPPRTHAHTHQWDSSMRVLFKIKTQDFSLSLSLLGKTHAQKWALIAFLA